MFQFQTPFTLIIETIHFRVISIVQFQNPCFLVPFRVPMVPLIDPRPDVSTARPTAQKFVVLVSILTHKK